jgi:hypothetical protein
MKKRDRQTECPPPQAAPHIHGALDEAQALFERMKSDVVGQAVHEREEFRSRGAFVRLLLVLTIVACLLAAGTMLYGVYNFPDAPIRQAESEYVGKGGRPRTQDEFEVFSLWRKAMFIIIPSVFVLGFAFVITNSRRRRKRMAWDPERRKE